MDYLESKTCCFTGHRPEKCMGTEESIRSKLREAIADAESCGYDTFISGMALGVDIWAAEEILDLKENGAKLKLICAIPFQGFERNRSEEQQEEYRIILNKADETVFISPNYERWCFHARDEWMVDHSSRVIAVFNGTSGGTKSTIQYANRMQKTVILIEDTAG